MQLADSSISLLLLFLSTNESLYEMEYLLSKLYFFFLNLISSKSKSMFELSTRYFKKILNRFEMHDISWWLDIFGWIYSAAQTKLGQSGDIQPVYCGSPERWVKFKYKIEKECSFEAVDHYWKLKHISSKVIVNFCEFFHFQFFSCVMWLHR